MTATRIALALAAVCLAGAAEARCLKGPRFLTEEYLRGWPIIAYGEVTSVYLDGQGNRDSYSDLQIQGVWQGKPSNPMRIFHPDGFHGYKFEQGESYLVFVSTEGERAIATICGPTCKGEQCVPLISLLGEPAERLD